MIATGTKRAHNDEPFLPLTDGSKTSICLFTVLVLFIFEPAWFSEFPIVDRLFDIGKVLGLAVGLLFFFRNRINTVIVLSALYCAITCAITLMFEGSIMNAVSSSITCLSAVLLLYALLSDFQTSSIKALLLVFEFLIYGNLISVLCAPNGLYRLTQVTGWWTDACWFLGIRNGMTGTYVLGAFVELANVLINNYDKKSIVRCSAYFILSTASIFLINSSVTQMNVGGSAGGLTLIWAITLLYFILRFFKRALRFFDIKFVMIANIAITVLLVFAHIQERLSYIIVDLLHKDVTLAGRNLLWDNAIQLIARSPWIGYGIEPGNVMASKLNFIASVSTTQNGWLDILYIGGILLLTVVIALLFYCSHRINNCNLSYQENFLICYMLFSFMLIGQTESLVGARFFAFLVIAILLAKRFEVDNLSMGNMAISDG